MRIIVVHSPLPQASEINRPARSGMTLVEVLSAIALAGLAAMMLFASHRLANSMIHSSRLRLEAGALAMDQIMEVFNTWNFSATILATNLPPGAPPPGRRPVPSREKSKKSC